jgi:uncharacterized protein (TIGR00730 family)
MNHRLKVAVFCGARFPKLPADQLDAFILEVKNLSHQLALQYDLVYGGGTVGLMGLIADQFLNSGAKAYGVIPHYLNTVEIEHTRLTETHHVLDLHERKAKMEVLADMFLIFPGGVGTADEFLEVLTLKSLRRHQKPIHIWNWGQFFDGVTAFLNDGVRLGFVDSNIFQHCVIEANSKSFLDNLLSTPSKLS